MCRCREGSTVTIHAHTIATSVCMRSLCSVLRFVKSSKERGEPAGERSLRADRRRTTCIASRRFRRSRLTGIRYELTDAPRDAGKLPRRTGPYEITLHLARQRRGKCTYIRIYVFTYARFRQNILPANAAQSRRVCRSRVPLRRR